MAAKIQSWESWVDSGTTYTSPLDCFYWLMTQLLMTVKRRLNLHVKNITASLTVGVTRFQLIIQYSDYNVVISQYSGCRRGIMGNIYDRQHIFCVKVM